jgi:hypothetical protein
MRVSQKRRNEIRQGFRTGGNLLFGFATMGLVGIGTTAISGGDTGRINKVEALLAYALGIAILYWKATGYSGFIAGFFGIPAVFNSIVVLIAGHALNQPDVPVPSSEALKFLMFSVCLTAVTFPFTKPRELDPLSRVSVVLAVLAFFLALTNQARLFLWLTVCLVFFTVAGAHAMTRKELRALRLLRHRGPAKSNG